MRWRVYYGDGSTYGPDEPPEDAPALNVQAVAWDHPEHGRQVMYGRDFYWWVDETEGWYAGDIFGLWDHLVEPGWHRVLFGRSIPGDRFRAVIDRATTEGW